MFEFFCVLSQPHVLFLYVVAKILAQEIPYQTMGDGLSKVMKERKKTMWLVFPYRCGLYSLQNFKHATKDMEEIQLMNFPTILIWKYDPVDNVKNVTTREKIKKLTKEPDKFDGFFQSLLN